MARPELPGAAVPIQPPVSPFRWAARTRFSSLLPKCSFIFRMVVVYWSWNCESCPEIKYFSLFLRTALLFQLLPVRGRKLIPAVIPINSLHISTSPRKGTETYGYYHEGYNKRFQLLPVRGRKLIMLRNLMLDRIFQLIPARGRKPLRYPEHQQQPDFNLSPQGDGNYLTLKSSDMVWISTYPRKGTETESFMELSYNQAKFNLSPQTFSGAARQLSRRESFSGCHLPCTKLPLSGELARRKP